MVIVDDQNFGVRSLEFFAVLVATFERFFVSGFVIAERFPFANNLLDGERKRRAFAVNACDVQRTAHHLKQTFRYVHAEPGTFDVAVALLLNALKFGEKFLNIFGLDSDARVLDGNVQQDGVGFVGNFFIGDAERDGAFFRVLDRVRQNVRDDLLDTNFVAAQEFGRILVEGKRKRQIFVVRLNANHVNQVVEQGRYVIVDGDNFHFARLNLAEVEDIVDETEQGTARRAHAFGVGKNVRVVGFAQNHFVQAEDGINRRANFVAHVRQERRFCLACGKGARRCLR